MNKDSKFLVDGHIHTLECGHAYNTITEMAKAAADQGLEVICWTEHGPKLPNGSSFSFFNNLQTIPSEIEGVKVLKGIEANILEEGKLQSKGLEDKNLDISKGFADKLEVVSASLHNATFKPKSKEENTEAILAAINNPRVDFLCHLGNPRYPIDFEKVISEAAKNNKMIEINNGSFTIRKGSTPNCIEIAKLAKKYDVPIIVGSDAHFSDAVGKFPYAKKLLEVTEYPDELIMNLHPDKLIDHLKAKGKPVGFSRHENADEILKQIEEGVSA